MAREPGPLEPTPFVQSLIDCLDEIVVVIGLDFRLAMMNRAARELYLAGPDPPGPLYCYSLFHHNSRECPACDMQCPVALVRESGRPVEVVHRHYGKDGPKAVEITASPLLDAEGRLSGVVESCRDLTRKSDLSAMVVHDIKSPLSVILGYSKLLVTDKIDEMSRETAEMVSAVHKNSLKLLGLVEDLLTVSRLESKEPFVDTQWTCLEGLLLEAHETFWGAAVGKGIDLVVEPCAGIPDAAIDRKLVMRALSNLIQNAIAYTPRGGKVTVRAVTSFEQGRVDVVLSVSDTGIGIAADEQERIFEMYYRSPRIAGTKGSGLGLAIVKGVADLHGGRVDLKSEQGKGSTFRLILPVMPKAA